MHEEPPFIKKEGNVMNGFQLQALAMYTINSVAFKRHQEDRPHRNRMHANKTADNGCWQKS